MDNETSPNFENPACSSTPDNAWEKKANWIRKKLVEFLSVEETNAYRDALKQVELEKARRLRIENDFVAEKQQIELDRMRVRKDLEQEDVKSQITARNVLSIQRLTNAYINLKENSPDVMNEVAFQDYIELIGFGDDQTKPLNPKIESQGGGNQ